MNDEVADFMLQPGETLLWTGRPRYVVRHDRRWLWGKIKSAFWGLCVPVAGLILLYLGYVSTAPLKWGLALMALIWLWSGVHAFLFEPREKARRLRNTRYALTNVRVIVDRQGKSERELTSEFLDMMGYANVTDHGDGTGTVGQFEYIEEPLRVHQMMVDAIRQSGGPLAGRKTLLDDLGIDD